jgi:hypothetical protein
MNVRVAFPETCAPGILRSSQRLAFAILDKQLSVASLDDISKAETGIAERLRSRTQTARSRGDVTSRQETEVAAHVTFVERHRPRLSTWSYETAPSVW